MVDLFIYGRASPLVPVERGTDELWYSAAYQHQAAGAVGRDVQHSAPK